MHTPRWAVIHCIHVIPLDDYSRSQPVEHLWSPQCPCSPKVEFHDNGNDKITMYIHNAYDGREYDERRKAMLKTVPRERPAS